MPLPTHASILGSENLGSESPRSAHDAEECRCLCGSLVARVVARGIELKCRRCKRVLLVPLAGIASTERGSAIELKVVPVSSSG